MRYDVWYIIDRDVIVVIGAREYCLIDIVLTDNNYVFIGRL